MKHIRRVFLGMAPLCLSSVLVALATQSHAQIITKSSANGVATIILSSKDDVLSLQPGAENDVRVFHGTEEPTTLSNVKSINLIDKGGSNSVTLQGLTALEKLSVSFRGRGDQLLELTGVVVADDLKLNGGNGDHNILLNNVRIGDDTRIKTGAGADSITLSGVEFSDTVSLSTAAGDDTILTDKDAASSIGGIATINTANGADTVSIISMTTLRPATITTGSQADSISLINNTFRHSLTVRSGSQDDIIDMTGNVVEGRATVFAESNADIVTLTSNSFSQLLNLNTGANDDTLTTEDNTFSARSTIHGSGGRADRLIQVTQPPESSLVRILGFETITSPGDTLENQATIEEQSRASRFLQMAALNATEEQINEVIADGFETWLNKQFALIDPGTRFDWMRDNGYVVPARRNTLNGFNNAIWHRLFTAKNGVKQRMTLALSEIFVVNVKHIQGTGTRWRAFGGAAFMDMLESHAFGNYRDLLEDVTLSHQMGAYLTLQDSKRADDTGRAPDENYAREVLQLFSIGLHELNNDGTLKLAADGNPIETYTNADIEGLAAALTGWTGNFTEQQVETSPDHHRLPMLMNDADHELSEVKLLGTSIPANTDGQTALQIALDRIFHHPNVGPFIGRQLIQRFVTSNPSPAYIDRVASTFNADKDGNRGNLAAVLKAVLLDPEALNEPVATDLTSGRLREPFLRFIQWGRTFKINDPRHKWEIPDLSDTRKLAQSPMYSPSVFNFFRPGYIPSEAAIGELGLTVPELQLTNETTVAGFANFMTTTIPRGINGVQPDYTKERALATDATKLVDRLNLLLTANQLQPETYDLIVSAVDSLPRGSTTKKVYAAILMVLLSPDYLVLR